MRTSAPLQDVGACEQIFQNLNRLISAFKITMTSKPKEMVLYDL